MTCLVLLDHDAARIKQSSRSAIAAAAKLGDIHALVAGENIGAIAQDASKISGITKVLMADNPGYAFALAEPLAALIASLSVNYSHILAAATAIGKNVLPRAAALLDCQIISGISDVVDAETFVRPIYAGNAIATVKSIDTKKLITVRAASFEPVASEGGNAAIEPVTAALSEGDSKFISAQLSKSERPELTAAKIVIAGGRGMQSGENFEKLIEPVAKKLGAAIGASRAAVDAGYVSNDYQVGQTGKIVAPDLYIAVGISGAIQHLAGMKDSKIIVAINRDEDAPIFQIADYGLVGDLFAILPELEESL